MVNIQQDLQNIPDIVKVRSYTTSISVMVWLYITSLSVIVCFKQASKHSYLHTACIFFELLRITTRHVSSLVWCKVLSWVFTYYTCICINTNCVLHLKAAGTFYFPHTFFLMHAWRCLFHSGDLSRQAKRVSLKTGLVTCTQSAYLAQDVMSARNAGSTCWFSINNICPNLDLLTKLLQIL